jgi:hypothetical protein
MNRDITTPLDISHVSKLHAVVLNTISFFQVGTMKDYGRKLNPFPIQRRSPVEFVTMAHGFLSPDILDFLGL